MSEFNQVVISGRLGRDPDLRYSPKGIAIVQFSMAVSETWKDESGEQKQRTSWINFSAFGRTAETLSQYVKKGHRLGIVGKLQTDEWDDKQTNQKRSATKVTVERIIFMEKKESDGNAAERPPAPSKFAGMRAATAAPAEDTPIEEDDVPF